ncbi:diaminopimelate decarboxylase family protein [Actinomadura chibensis]|uniref:diaminopimelate decarboxylase family protein n=1 Tax=Actinomadura chibensis TaxID=392828 RepID=UPI000836EC00|nr:diaminopimelate decarboxylase [Actinomadura chibensis]
MSPSEGLDAVIWPSTAYARTDGDVAVGGVALSEVAAGFGTPVHVMDEEDVRRRCREFRAAFSGGEVAFAGKAFLCRAMARWAAEEGLSLDVVSAGELAVARSVGFPGERMLMHGNAKTPEDLRAALAYGVGRIVVDSFGEITRLASLAGGPVRPRLMVRVTPGVDGRTHPAMSTGTDDQKFGFSPASGAASEAVRRVLAQRELALAGLHCHIGSQVSDPAAFERAARRMVGLLAAVRDEHGVSPPQLDLGGGFAVPYRTGERGLAPEAVAELTRTAVRTACREHRLPGLYGAAYSARLLGHGTTAADRSATVVGRHCESGDVLVRDVPLPADVRPGDLLAVPCTGAYHHSMASNYNLVCRPPVVAVRAGRARLLIRRETDEDLLRRDVG